MAAKSVTPQNSVDFTTPASTVVSNGLESSKTLDEKPNPETQLSTKYAATFAIMAAYFGVTLVLGMIGPSLLDLQLLTSTTTSEISTIFTCRGVLAIVSSLVMGPVLDSVSHLLVVAISLLALFMFLAVTPWSNSLLTVLLTMGPPEFFSCAIGMGVHLIGLELWQEKAGPVMQGLNLVSIVGFMVAPLLVQPFLSATDSMVNGTDTDHSDLLVAVTMATHLDDIVVVVDKPKFSDSQLYDQGVSTGEVSTNHSTTPYNLTADGSVVATTNVKYAYWIAAIYCWVVGIFVLFVCSKMGFKLKHKPEESESDSNKGKASNIFVASVALLYFFFNIFLAGIEVGYAGLLLTFAVNHFDWTKESATWLLALLQASNCVITALCIPLSRYVSPNKLLAVDLTLLNVVLILEAIFVEDHPILLWVCTAGIGAGYAIVMPSSLTWIDTFLQVSGKFSSAYWGGYFVGFMTIPAVSGFLFHHVHPLWFIYITLGCAVSMAMLFVVLSAIVYRNQLNRGAGHAQSAPTGSNE